MVPVLKLAEYVLYICESKDTPISNLRLQQLLYILQREYLRIESHPLFSEAIEARDFGPCIPDVYYHYCHYGAMEISLSWTRAEFNKDSYEFDNALKNLIDDITNKYASAMPWDIAPIVQKDAYKKAWTKFKTMDDVELPKDFQVILLEDIQNEK